jgi:hypothetical protein
MEEITTAVMISPSAGLSYNQAEVDTQVSTAKAYPRSIKRSVEEAITVITMDAETAHSCSYSLPRDGKLITGPSVHMAKILAQAWGNIRAGSRVVSTDDNHVVSEGVCWDMEKNVAMQSNVRRKITGKSGKKYSDDMITVTGQAANSIALRNAIFSVIPKGVVNKVYKAAIEKITGDVSDENKLIARRKAVVDRMIESYKVTEAEILASVGRASLDHIGAEEIAVLIGVGQAIKDGATTIDEAFKRVKPQINRQVEEVSKQKELERYEAHVRKLDSKQVHDERENWLTDPNGQDYADICTQILMERDTPESDE